MTQKFLKLLLLVSCVLPVQVSARVDQSKKAAPAKKHSRSVELAALAAQADDADSDATRKVLTSLEVAGSGAIRDLLQVGSLNVENGESVGGDLNVDGRLFANGLVLNGAPLFAPQYAYIYDQTTAQTVANGAAFNFTPPIGQAAVFSSGFAFTSGGSNLTMNVPGVYAASYVVVLTLPDGTVEDPSLLNLNLKLGTNVINGSSYGFAGLEAATGDQVQVSGQVVFAVTAATAGQNLTLVNASGAAMTTAGNTVVGASLRVQRIG